jgi:hypothetical protein
VGGVFPEATGSIGLIVGFVALALVPLLGGGTPKISSMLSSSFLFSALDREGTARIIPQMLKKPATKPATIDRFGVSVRRMRSSAFFWSERSKRMSSLLVGLTGIC